MKELEGCEQSSLRPSSQDWFPGRCLHLRDRLRCTRAQLKCGESAQQVTMTCRNSRKSRATATGSCAHLALAAVQKPRCVFSDAHRLVAMGLDQPLGDIGLGCCSCYCCLCSLFAHFCIFIASEAVRVWHFFSASCRAQSPRCPRCCSLLPYYSPFRMSHSVPKSLV